MNLKPPFSIGSRLLPCLKIGDGEVSLEFVGVTQNRMTYRWYIDIPAGEFSEADLRTGTQTSGGSEVDQAMFGTLLAFLSACADAHHYWLATGRESENYGLFPPEVAAWAYEHDNEINCLREEVGSTAGLLAD